MTMDDQERAAFEKWADLSSRQAWRTKEGREYRDQLVQAKWMGWQARANAAPVAAPVAIRGCIEGTWFYGPWSAETEMTEEWEPLYAAPVAAAPVAAPDDAKDAARYRWLRDEAVLEWHEGDGIALVIPEPMTGEDWKATTDSAIDAAMPRQ